MAGSAVVVDTVEELIAHGIDARVVAVPTAFHLEAGLQLAAAGVHTLIEKPLATDAERGPEARRGLRGRGPGQRRRPHRALQPRPAGAARAPRRTASSARSTRSPRGARARSRTASPTSGVVKDLATHDIDLTAWVIRSPYAEVSAQHRPQERPRARGPRLGHRPDGDGTVASHLVNWLSPLKERVTVVTGERGAFVADTLHGDLTFHENGLVTTEWDQVATFRGVSEGNSTRFAIAKPEPLRVEHEQFRDAVLGQATDIVTMREGLATVTVADACLDSARERPHRSTLGPMSEAKLLKIAVVGLGKIGLPLAAQFADQGHDVVGCRHQRRDGRDDQLGRGAVPGRGPPRRVPRRGSCPPVGCAPPPTTPTRCPAPTSWSSSVPLFVDETATPDFGWMDQRDRDIAAPPDPGHPRRLRDHPARRHHPRTLEAAPRGGQRSDRGHRLPPRLLPRAGADRPGLRRPAQVPQARRRPRPRRRQGRRRASTSRRSSSTSGPTWRAANGVWDLGSAEAAEMAKLAETTYRDVNIGLANQFARLRRARRHRRLPGDRGLQLPALQPHPPPRHRRRRPLHPGLPAPLPVQRPRRHRRPRRP